MSLRIVNRKVSQNIYKYLPTQHNIMGAATDRFVIVVELYAYAYSRQSYMLGLLRS